MLFPEPFLKNLEFFVEVQHTSNFITRSNIWRTLNLIAIIFRDISQNFGLNSWTTDIDIFAPDISGFQI